MKKFNFIGIILGSMLLAGSTSVAMAASGAHLATECSQGTMATYLDKVPDISYQHHLTDAEKDKILKNYTGRLHLGDVRLFTLPSATSAVLIFGNTKGCASFKLSRDLEWISGLLGREIKHPQE